MQGAGWGPARRQRPVSDPWAPLRKPTAGWAQPAGGRCPRLSASRRGGGGGAGGSRGPATGESHASAGDAGRGLGRASSRLLGPPPPPPPAPSPRLPPVPGPHRPGSPPLPRACPPGPLCSPVIGPTWRRAAPAASGKWCVWSGMGRWEGGRRDAPGAVVSGKKTGGPARSCPLTAAEGGELPAGQVALGIKGEVGEDWGGARPPGLRSESALPRKFDKRLSPARVRAQTHTPSAPAARRSIVCSSGGEAGGHSLALQAAG